MEKLVDMLVGMFPVIFGEPEPKREKVIDYLEKWNEEQSKIALEWLESFNNLPFDPDYSSKVMPLISAYPLHLNEFISEFRKQTEIVKDE